MSSLLGLAEAQHRLLALARPSETVTLAVEAALGHYLAEQLIARRAQPSHPLSAMDGWAVRQADFPGPWQVVGESAAGHPFTDSVEPGKSVRISTGAIVPQGADMVLVQEQCTRNCDALSFAGDPPHPPGRHIRTAGLDFRESDIVAENGAAITPARLALAISAGHGEVTVHRPPRIAVIDSGDELVAAGMSLSEGQIPASNGPMLAAMLADLPCSVTRHGPIPDSVEALTAALDAAGSADLVITSGGASVGDHDLLRPALEAAGAEIDFWRVAIKPGKPIMVARRGEQVILGLPGNPVSAFVTATLFALPLVRAMLGAADPLPATEMMVTTSPLPATGKRAEFLRGHIVDGAVELLKLQDSGALSPLAAATVLIHRPAHAEAVASGELVPILRIA